MAYEIPTKTCSMCGKTKIIHEMLKRSKIQACKKCVSDRSNEEIINLRKKTSSDKQFNNPSFK